MRLRLYTAAPTAAAHTSTTVMRLRCLHFPSLPKGRRNCRRLRCLARSKSEFLMHLETMHDLNISIRIIEERLLLIPRAVTGSILCIGKSTFTH